LFHFSWRALNKQQKVSWNESVYDRPL
jgi:hypothetical protein